MFESEPGTGITRRQALKRGAAVAGAAVWVAPTVQALTMSAASAQTPSGSGGTVGANAGGNGKAKKSKSHGKGTGIIQSGGRANENAGG